MSDRPTRDCQCKRANHQHGTVLAYSIDKCRCPDCTKAMARYDKVKSIARHRGTHRHLVDGADARRNLRTLHNTLGVSMNGIAQAAGVAMPTVSEALQADAKIRFDVAAALARVTLDDLPDSAEVSARGVGRRLQALACLGWSPNRVADMAGVTSTTTPSRILSGKKTRVTMSTHRAVDAVYKRLQSTRFEPRDRMDRMAYTKATERAAREGWAPPAMWDDIDLDDRPASTPAYKTISDMEARRQDAVDLIAGGYAPATVMGRLGIRTVRDLKLMLATAGRADLAEEAALAHQVWQDAA
ncbi:hypothetical protein M3E78_005740 [Micrococcus luteus]|nr:hypothetical protein [Micrococcus luteus]MCV7574092.1 hypothetical protein [Micrococcus luteus]